MGKRTRYSLLVVLVLIAGLAVTLWLRKTAPPEVARLLPESDAILYANLAPVRLATHFDRNPPTRSQDYQHFVDATGIVPERDLNAVAFALHRMDDPRGPNGPVAYSEVMEGRLDGARLAKYLLSIAVSEEDYAHHTVYTIPVEGRALRIAQLGYDTVAASNMPTAEQIHEILDRYRASASPFAGSSLLAARYRDVPLLSSVWAIGHVGLPFSESGRISVLGLQLPLAEDTTFVASLRFSVGSLKLRIEQIAPTEAEAIRTTDSLVTLLHLVQTLPSHLTGHATSPGTPTAASTPNDSSQAALRQFTDSIKIEQHKDRIILTGNVPSDLARTLANPAAKP